VRGPGSDLGLDVDQALDLYRRMRLIRRFEELVVELVNKDEIAGVTHEYVGQEAVAVGVCAALLPDDVITSTHRGHGHIIAKGGRVDRMLAELMGRGNGYNRGRGGSMHIADFSLGILGANGIVGAGAPMACGAAHAFRARGHTHVAVSFFGDGAANQGVLLESLNLAAAWKLPVVFVCENNLYALTTPISAMTGAEIWRRAEGFGMPAAVVDGMDVIAVRAAAAEAVGRARDGGGPSFLECRTYRFRGHYTAEAIMKLTYRTEEEVADWRRRDPVEAWRNLILARGLATDDQLEALDGGVEAELEAGLRFAREGAWPEPAEAFDLMYASDVAGLPVKGWEPSAG
jgi:acetoin:2,6-dichlorophenolindophenol oxidoreductase subunit alpha